MAKKKLTIKEKLLRWKLGLSEDRLKKSKENLLKKIKEIKPIKNK